MFGTTLSQAFLNEPCTIGRPYIRLSISRCSHCWQARDLRICNLWIPVYLDIHSRTFQVTVMDESGAVDNQGLSLLNHQPEVNLHHIQGLCLPVHPFIYKKCIEDIE